MHEGVVVRGGDLVGSKVLVVNDVARASFQAPAVRHVCVQVLDDDKNEVDASDDNVGHLKMSLDGA